MKKILITGGLGFIGVNTALKLAQLGFYCTVVDNFFRTESKRNLNLLNNQNNISFIKLDITNKLKVEELIKQNKFFAVLNFAGQVAMNNSIKDPYVDFNINTIGSINILEALRKHSKKTIYFYTSTNKVYGDISWDKLKTLKMRYESLKYKHGYNTLLGIDLSTPYGCSKGAADLYAIDYSKTFGLKTIVLRLSTIYGEHQISTYNQGWIGWFTSEALNKKNNSTLEISGTGKQVRDILHIDDFLDLIVLMLKFNEKFVGKKFNIGGGYENSISILELIDFLETSLSKNFQIKNKEFRVSDQKYYVSDLRDIKKLINWKPKVDKFEGLTKNLIYLKKQNE